MKTNSSLFAQISLTFDLWLVSDVECRTQCPQTSLYGHARKTCCP